MRSPKTKTNYEIETKGNKVLFKRGKKNTLDSSI